MSDIYPKICVPVGEDNERSIWKDGYWTQHLVEWLHHLRKLFPTQVHEIDKLSPKECAETMRMYEREYVAWCAVRRMKRHE